MLGCLLWAACSTRAVTSPIERVEREHERVREATLRATARSILDQAVFYETHAVTWRWRLEVDQGEQAYSAAVVRALGSEYTCREDAAGLSCLRRFPGDSVRFSLRLAPQGAAMRVEAELTALPD